MDPLAQLTGLTRVVGRSGGGGGERKLAIKSRGTMFLEQQKNENLKPKYYILILTSIWKWKLRIPKNVTWRLPKKIKNTQCKQEPSYSFHLKGTVSVILSDPSCKDGMPDTQRYPLETFIYLINNVENIVVFLGLKVFNSNDVYMFFYFTFIENLKRPVFKLINIDIWFKLD